MKYSFITTLAALVACFFVLPVDGFSVSPTTVIRRQHTPYGSSPSHLFPTANSRHTVFLSSPSDDTDDLSKQTDETTPADASETSNKLSSTKDSSSQDRSWGVTKTILLTVPLFFKFLIVLVIKFMTDLVVFPLLFSYRMCRRAKRKVLGVFNNKKDTKLPNGETRP